MRMYPDSEEKMSRKLMMAYNLSDNRIFRVVNWTCVKYDLSLDTVLHMDLETW